MKSTFKLPCVYCNDGTGFPSAEKLKEHLLGNHKNLVCGGVNSFSLNDERSEKSVTSRRIHSAEPRKIKHDLIKPYRTDFNRNVRNSPNSSLTSPSLKPLSPSASDYTSTSANSALQDKKVGRLHELLQLKDKEIDRLQLENENLKSNSRIKDEEHSHIRQRWRKEAEDILRCLKTKYGDVLAQKRLLEKQFLESEQQKEQLRNKNDSLEKDLTDVQAKVASEKRILQIKEDQGHSININSTSTSVERKQFEKEKQITQRLSSELQTIRKENTTLSESLDSKDDILKQLRHSLNETENKLAREKMKYDTLNREMNSFKVKFAQSHRETNGPDKVAEELVGKLDESIECQNNLKKNVNTYKKKTESLQTEINTLKQDKQKLLTKLQEADKALLELSNRVSTSNYSLNNSSIFSNSIASLDQINICLDEIKSVLKQLPQQPDKAIEVHHIQVELQSANKQLIEEKAKVLQLSNSVAELEQFISDGEKQSAEYEAKYNELQKLRTKHQKCVRNDKVRKQLEKEKKLIQKKYSALNQQMQVMNALYENVQTDAANKDHILEELRAEKQEKATEMQLLKEEVEQSRKITSENNFLLEKYKRESCYLLEKLNTATEEHEEMKQRNESLELRLNELSSFTNIKESITFIQEQLIELKSIPSQSSSANVERSLSTVNFEVLSQKNMDLADKVLALQEKISGDQQEFQNLRQAIKDKDGKIEKCNAEIEKLNNIIVQTNFSTSKATTESNNSNGSERLQHAMTISKYEGQIESLTLEKEILASRVLILEGIREELDLLRDERDKLRVENQKFKRLLSQKQLSTTNNVNNTPTVSKNNSKLVIISNPQVVDSTSNDQFTEGLKHLEELDEDAKTRLQEILSGPEFEKLLSTDEVYIDLKDTTDISNQLNTKFSLNSLSNDSFENEHTINHMYQAESDPLLSEMASASYEDIIQVYTPSENMIEKDYEIDSSQETKEQQKTSKIDHVESPVCRNGGIHSNHPAKDHKTEYRSNNNNRNSDSNNEGIVLSNNSNKSLEKIVSESKLISKSIATSRRKTSEEIDYKQVLNEFQKVIGEMSGNNISSSQSSLDDHHKSFTNTRPKKVKFSDHIVDFYTDFNMEMEADHGNDESNEEERFQAPLSIPITAPGSSSDSNFYRSFFQDALKKTYPELVRSEEGEDVDGDLTCEPMNQYKKSLNLTNGVDFTNKNTKDSNDDNSHGSIERYDNDNYIKNNKVQSVKRKHPSNVNITKTEDKPPILFHTETFLSPHGIIDPSNFNENEIFDLVSNPSQEDNSGKPIIDKLLDVVETIDPQVRQEKYNTMLKTFPPATIATTPRQELQQHEFSSPNKTASVEKSKLTSSIPSLPTLTEEQEADSDSESEQEKELRAAEAVCALNVLKSFINKASDIQQKQHQQSTPVTLMDKNLETVSISDDWTSKDTNYLTVSPRIRNVETFSPDTNYTATSGDLSNQQPTFSITSDNEATSKNMQQQLFSPSTLSKLFTTPDNINYQQPSVEQHLTSAKTFENLQNLPQTQHHQHQLKSPQFIIPTIITSEFVDDKNLFPLANSATGINNDSNNDITLIHTSSLVSDRNTESNVINDRNYSMMISPLHIGSDESFDNFDKMKFGREHRTEMPSRSSLSFDETRRFGASSTPSNMHTPVSLDFSDDSFLNASLFSNVND